MFCLQFKCNRLHPGPVLPPTSLWGLICYLSYLELGPGSTCSYAILLDEASSCGLIAKLNLGYLT